MLALLSAPSVVCRLLFIIHYEYILSRTNLMINVVLKYLLSVV